ncbi:MAG: monovalent cation/H+ antiporter complex subunit F [Polyangia bacterium]
MIWKISALVMCLGLIPCAILALRGRLIDRLIGLELAGVLLSQICFLWAVGIDRPPFVDIGLTVAILAFGAGLVFARFLERWL